MKYDISIIIPIYNVEKYLTDCLNSVCHQTKEDIEIICIDDCSTDDSSKVIDEFAQMDDRIKVIRNQKNCGRLYARKSGVLEAVGKYIMFLDGDDFYSEDACEIAYSQIESESVDILQFGMNIINKGNAPQYEVDSFSNFVMPYEGKIEKESVLKSCFVDEKYNYNLVNKIYKTELCKKAFANLDDRYYCMAEDLLAYFVLSYYAESYAGITDKLYNYNFAIGVSKPGALDLEGLDRRCAGAESVAAVERFLTGQGTFDEYQDAYQKIERRILSDNFDAWYYRLPSDKREEGYAIFEKHWGKDKVILGLLYDIENKQYDINQKGNRINELGNELTCARRRFDEELTCERERFDKELAQKNLVIDQLDRENNILTQRLEEKTSLYEKTEQERNDAQAQYEHVLNSLSYKIGCAVTWLPRKIAGVIRRTKNR